MVVIAAPHSGLVGYDMAVKAAQEVYAQADIAPGEVDVVELHDCFSTNELITYEALVCAACCHT